MKTCNCGRPIPQRFNSTIQGKMCPACTLKSLQKPKSGVHATGRKALGGGTNWMKIADLWFSRWIRISKAAAIIDGKVYVYDIINGKPYAAEDVDNGHFISRANLATRYDEDNCWPQNRSSNRFRGEADKWTYEQNLLEKLGREGYDALMDRSRRIVHIGQLEYKEIADLYRNKVNNLCKKHGIEKWW